MTGNRRPTTRRAALLVGIIALALVGRGCSSDSTAGDPSPAQPTPLTIDGPALATLVEQMAERDAGSLGCGSGAQSAGRLRTSSTDHRTGRRPADHVRRSCGSGRTRRHSPGTAILQMVQEGQVEPRRTRVAVHRRVPDGENIPIRLLLNMRSGLFNYSETLELNESLDETPEAEWTPQDLPPTRLQQPALSLCPGEGYHYSNTNTVLLGLIAEKLDGKPLPQVFETVSTRPWG